MFFHKIRKKFTLQNLQKLLNQRPVRSYIPDANCLLYVTANCLPYHVSGYTTRTHELLLALGKEGITVHAITRSGYPWDHAPTVCEAGPSSTHYQGVHYHHSKYPRKLLSLTSFVEKSAHYIVKQAQEHKVACIQAASNYVNALPALVAARWLNIPFQYEMRGHWELSRAAQKKIYAKSHAYDLGLCLEQFVVQNAERVFFISEALASFMQLQVDNNKVCLLPNCVDNKRIYPMGQKATDLHMGYAGALVSYEGLDILLYALNKLVQAKRDVFLHIIGDGQVKKDLENLAQDLGLQNHVRFYGKLSPEEARQHLERCALVCIPRAPLDVCKIVPPLKLVEAMALGKTLVLPKLPVFREEARQVPVFFFEAGNIENLTYVLDKALSNTQDLNLRGQICQKYVLEHRQWKHFIKKIMPQAK